MELQFAFYTLGAFLALTNWVAMVRLAPTVLRTHQSPLLLIVLGLSHGSTTLLLIVLAASTGLRVWANKEAILAAQVWLRIVGYSSIGAMILESLAMAAWLRWPRRD